MEVTRAAKLVRADAIGAGNTFKYLPPSVGTVMDFLVIGNNDRFKVFKKGDGHRVEYQNVMIYNISAACWGIVPAGTMVEMTDSELNING